jgi:riboflavin kinase/FMN adenylyltransferase
MEHQQGTVVAIGNFDGFHLGHRKLIDTLNRIAWERKLKSVVLTFTPNPKIYFNKELNLITSDEQKRQILEGLDVDDVTFLDFDRISHLSGEAFVENVLIGQYSVKYIVMGENFRFGKNRESDVDSLKRMARTYGFEIIVVAPLVLDGIPISSSLIRHKLSCADIEASNRMLGRLYYIDGVVEKGDKIGRQLGFPTINIDTRNEILPEGVFKTRTEILSHRKVYDSITYIGTSPTFSGKEKKIETHILDFDRNIYGEKVRIYFQKRLRGEMKFDSRRNLIDQIKEDIRNLGV